MSPQALFALQLRFATLAIETQTVVALRILGMSGLIPQTPGENARMVAEKAPAMTKSFTAATQAMMRGQSPERVINAALTPVSQKVHANRKRLVK